MIDDRQLRVYQHGTLVPICLAQLRQLFHSQRLFIACCGMLMTSLVLGADVREFVSTYCISCHGASKQKADRRFDLLSLPPNNEDTLIDLQDIVDQLTLGEMPPKAASPQPTVAQRTEAIAALTAIISAAHQSRTSTGGHAVLRRLNRDEYLNTIRDLMGMNMTMFDPAVKFPRDQTVEHLDTVGDTLVMSGYLLHQYLFAADQIIEKALPIEDQPAEQTWTFKDRFLQQPELDKAHDIAFNNRFMCLYECPQSERPEGAYGPLLKFREGVPVDGFYEVRVHAAALHRINPYDRQLLGLDPAEPLRLGIVPGNAAIGTMHVPQPFHSVLAEVELPDNEPQWQTFNIWLDAGFSPRFIFPNGIMDIRAAYAPLVRRYGNLSRKSEISKGGIVGNRIALLSDGELPQIRIDEVVIRGPLIPSSPTPKQRWLGDRPFSAERTEELLKRFATAAYRRPVTQTEMEQLMALVSQRAEAGRAPWEAYKDALKSVLCSTAFLYLPSTTTQPQGDERPQLTAHTLASRLSYFLWSSMPDDELLRLASTDDLLQPEMLRTQTRRMLNDDRSDAFVKRFLDSWLNLRSLGDMPPDRKMFEQYYLQNLQDAMRQETFLFARDLIGNDKSILNFIDADYSFLNRNLAVLYGLDDEVPAPDGHLFRQVSFSDKHRGGLLGQGSVLTVTANGIETSPVIRGVWLLENVLGTPPAPPPDDVPAIDPDVRGATSIGDLLAKHRSSVTCNECHQKIDPLGFALENFDPIGQWRDDYPGGKAIDTAGVLPSGEAFDDVEGLKRILLERKEFFARMLTEKLLAYGCGRRMEPLDRPQVEAIVARVREAGYPLRTLIEEVVVSDLFRQNGGSSE